VNTYSDPQIYRNFDKNLGKYDAGHRGLDLYADVNTQVNAPVDGEVLWKGVVANKPTVTFKSGEYKLTFEPVSTPFSVGTPIKKGEQLGNVSEYRDGSEHCDRSCVHWGVLRGDGNYLDPLERVYKKKIVLKKF
jgi:murein DD-endopeptidase MepM/ murein hydrolase activator NlpD